MRYFSITYPQRALRLFSSVQHTLNRQTPPNSLKRREFDEIVFFSAGSEKSSVLGVHDFSGSAEKAKYRELSPFYKIKAAR